MTYRTCQKKKELKLKNIEVEITFSDLKIQKNETIMKCVEFQGNHFYPQIIEL